VAGQTVYLETDVSETDRYDRLLRYVYLADGTFVNAELVRLGWATAKAYPPDTKHQGLLAAREQEARQAQRGIWAATSR
jgi:micrococcal nuclease